MRGSVSYFDDLTPVLLFLDRVSPHIKALYHPAASLQSHEKDLFDFPSKLAVRTLILVLWSLALAGHNTLLLISQA
jgi:hypothetical protein